MDIQDHEVHQDLRVTEDHKDGRDFQETWEIKEMWSPRAQRSTWPQGPEGECGKKGYTIEFPKKGVKDYMQVWGMPNMKSFTVCFWVKTKKHYGTPFSYAASSSAHNELLIETPGSFKMIIGHNKKV